MRAPSVGVGVAGLGTIGRVHATNLAAPVPGARLAGVADISEPAARAVGEMADVPYFESYERLLEDRRVDAIVIATPPSTHAELVMLAAAAEKHVFCEKPLALDIGLAEQALDAVAHAGVLLQVGFHRRFDRDFVEVKSRIETGRVGDVYAFFGSMRDRQPPPLRLLEAGEQTLLHDTTCHDLDAARWLLGEIDEICAFGAALTSPTIGEIGQIDHVMVFVRFESGALGAIENSLASGYGFDCRCEIVGSEATLRVDRPHLTAVEQLIRGTGGFERTPTFFERFSDAYPRELESFVAAVAGSSELVVSGEDGLAAVVLVDAAERSLNAGCRARLRRRVNGRLRYELERPAP